MVGVQRGTQRGDECSEGSQRGYDVQMGLNWMANVQRELHSDECSERAVLSADW